MSAKTIENLTTINCRKSSGTVVLKWNDDEKDLEIGVDLDDRQELIDIVEARAKQRSIE